jgi:hypothetical protein
MIESKPAGTQTADPWRTLSKAPEFNRLIAALGSSGLAEVKVIEAAKTTPVKRKPKLKGRQGNNMFVLPNDRTTEEGASDKKRKR